MTPFAAQSRIAGTTASLCGLERALQAGDERLTDLAIRRILLLHGVTFTIGGIPLIYAGDGIGTLNDYRFRQDPEKEGDTRWVHRAKYDRERAERRRDPTTVEGRIFAGLLRLIQVRQTNFAFTRSETEIVDTGNDHVLGYFRQHFEQSVLVLANFTEDPQEIQAMRLRQLGLRRTQTDIVAGRLVTASQSLQLEPYQLMILVRTRAE